MNEQAVLKTDLKRNLSNSLKERLALYIADCTADFGDNDISVRVFSDSIDKFLDFVCDMRNDLNSFAEVFAVALFFENI